MSHSVVCTTAAAYARAISRRGGRAFVKEFSFDYYDFDANSGRGRRRTAKFRVILDANRGSEANEAIRNTVDIGTRGLIPRLATREGVTPIFMGFSDLRKAGFVKVHYADRYDVEGHS